VSDTLVLVVLPATSVLFSAGLLAYALRGRRVNDHPICRKCGFDLFGKPADATRCSECGADLTRPRAVRVGRREKRRRLFGLALPVLVVCIAWLGLLGWGASRGTDWNKHKPVWWLMRDARGPGAATRDAALGELTRRVLDGKLSQQQIDALVDLALDVQADRSKHWVDGWGDAIGAARDAGKLSPEKWRRYARQGVEVKLETRPTLRREDPLFYQFIPGGPRWAARHAFDVTIKPGQVRAGGREVTVHYDHSATGVVKGGQWYPYRTNRLAPNHGGLVALPEGPHTFRSTVRLQVADVPGRTLGYLVDEHVEVTAPVTVLPAGAETVKLRTDPELKAAVEKALSVDRLEVKEAMGTPCVGIPVMATGLPVPAAFRVFARADDRRWELGTVHFATRKSPGFYLVKPLDFLPGFDPKVGVVDVVLKPSIDVAVTTPDLTEIWGGEVVVKGVRVSEGTSRSARPPATRPAGDGAR
jgi:hypothetical protein